MPSVRKMQIYEKNYDESLIQTALQAIKTGMPKKAASTKFGIPRSTLQFRLSEKFSKARPGPKTILTDEEEQILVKWIKECGRKGFPQRKFGLKISVQQFLIKNKRPNPFKDNFPGEKWYSSFIKRHPDVALRVSEPVTSASANVSKDNIKSWFEKIEIYLKDEGYFDILQDPKRIFNGDETNFQLCPKNEKVLTGKGNKNVYETDHAQAKTAITVMFTFSAAGECTPPMIIYPYKRLPVEILSSVPKDWGVGKTETGWMKSEVFYEYIGNVLYPHLKKQNVLFPVILFVDGHQSHLTFEISVLCNQLQIILVALYPNATRIIQPADVSAFKPLKNEWRKAVLRWRQNSPNEALTKFNFASVLKEAVDSLKSTAISNGFVASGLYPWDSDRIDYSKCLGKCMNEERSDQETICQNGKMDNETFEKLLTADLLQKVKQNEEPDDSSELKSLRKLWKYVSTKSSIENSDLTVNSYDKVCLDVETIPKGNEAANASDETIIQSPFNIETMPIIFQSEFPHSEEVILEPISQCLIWPRTPEKKGKRNANSNVPFVLTSKAWQDIHTKKKDDKERLEAEKHERKRIREANKELKKKKPKRKSNSKINIISDIVIHPPEPTYEEDSKSAEEDDPMPCTSKGKDSVRKVCYKNDLEILKDLISSDSDD